MEAKMKGSPGRGSDLQRLREEQKVMGPGSGVDPGVRLGRSWACGRWREVAEAPSCRLRVMCSPQTQLSHSDLFPS